MALTYRCLRCGFRITVTDRHAGKERVCPSCLVPGRVPLLHHRERLEVLHERSEREALTSAEWTEVATHYAALGDREKAERAERSADKAFSKETAYRVDAAVPDLLGAVEAWRAREDSGPAGDSEPQGRGQGGWQSLGAPIAVWAALALAWPPLGLLAATQVTTAWLLAAAATRYPDTAVRLFAPALWRGAGPTWLALHRSAGPRALVGEGGEARGGSGAGLWAQMARMSAVAWLVGVTISLYAVVSALLA